VSGSCSASVRSCSSWPAGGGGGDDGQRRLVGEDGEGLQARRGGQQAILGIVGPDAPEQRAVLGVEGHEEPVAVPGERTAPVHARPQLDVLAGRHAPADLRGEQVAAADLVGGVHQHGRRARGDLPLRLLAGRPARGGARDEAAAGRVDELDRDLLEAQRTLHAGAHRLQDRLDRLLAGGEHRRDGEQLLEHGAVARGLVVALGVLERARRVVGHGDDEVHLVLAGAPAGERLGEREDREDEAVGVAAGHEELVAGVPRLGVVA
jgi:hypothetical protein